MQRLPRSLPRLLDPPIRFSARPVRGAGRGRGLKVPTVNLDLSDAPKGLGHGIYVCRVTIAGTTYDGAMHFGPRPVFKDSESLEIHVLDASIADVPDSVDVQVLARIRDVMDFPDAETLKQAIAGDIEVTRAILKACP